MKTLVVAFCLFASVAFSAQDQIRASDRKPYLLSDSEVLTMKEQIRQQCNLPKAEEGSYPWYYHYELGLALQNKHDWQRALDSFISALDRHDQPKRASRIYGMWFLNYYPYYNIGLANYHLGNWKCASESFRLSQTLEDIPVNAPEHKNLLEYRDDVENHLNMVRSEN
jgi:hypothetical protein